MLALASMCHKAVDSQTELGRLEPGDVVAGLDESETPAVVEAVDHTRELRAVYNVRIPEAHTYFVGSLEWGFSLWAHNPDLDCDGRDDVTGEPVEGNAADAAERADEASEAAEGVVQKGGHPVPWNEMTKAQRKAFQHSYSRHAEELGLPKWKQSNAEALRQQFNAVVGHIRANGTKLPPGTRKPFNGQMVEVNFYEALFDGNKYCYYETLDGTFISAGLAR